MSDDKARAARLARVLGACEQPATMTTAARRRRLRAVLARHPRVEVVEDTGRADRLAQVRVGRRV